MREVGVGLREIFKAGLSGGSTAIRKRRRQERNVSVRYSGRRSEDFKE